MTTAYQPSIAPLGAEPSRPAQTEQSGHSSLDDVKAAFLKTYPEFASTSKLDELRATEYARLDEGEHIYLDYTGGGLYACSQVNQHMALLCSEVFGNPHSSNPTSLAMTRLVEQARAYVLEFFHASPDEYVAVFTTGCFCNPGGGELALGISSEELSACFTRSQERLTLDDFRRCIDDKSTGAVRVSVGLVTTFEDVYRFVQFASNFVDKPANQIQ